MKSYNVILLFVLLATSGAAVRYYLSIYSANLTSTIIANSLGCLLIGVFFCLKENQIIESVTWVLFAIAFLGALTTFSTYILDVFKLINDRSYLSAMKYILLTHLVAFGLCFVGYQMARKILN